MDSRIGLDYIVENREYISKLGAALDTNNAVVKKQVFELLSALCAYNADGYARAIETLDFYKNHKNERYRFNIVISELDKTTNVEYQVALLAFINCVIISASSLQNRIRIRNEFIGLKVLPILNNLRKVAQSVGDIIVQLDVFDEQRECDEVQSLQGPNGINLNSHLDVFYAILRQVADTPQEVPFLSILQHLLRIDSKEPVSDVIWDTTEKLVHRATLLENNDDSVRLLRTSSMQKFTCAHCRSDSTSPSRKPSGIPTSPNCGGSAFSIQQQNGPISPVPVPPAPPAPPLPAISLSTTTTTLSPPAPPMPPSAFVGNIPPPPPPPVTGGRNEPPAPPPPPIPCAPPAPPPPIPKNLHPNKTNPARPITPEPPGYNGHTAVLLPQQNTPVAKSKMKTINWGKIPQNRVLGKENIWTIVASNHQDSPMTDIDFNEMEGLFCLQSTSTHGSPKLGRDGGTASGYDTLDRKSRKENTEITLLDGKRSLNVNIFLKQFRTSNEDIIHLIKNGKHNDIGAEKLRGLLKILPEVDELDMLKTFNGDHTRLGNAEKFLLELLEVANYKLRIESMLLKEEFAANVSYLEPCISAMIYAGDDLINNKMLREVLYMVVVAGNFLNSGGYAGNAAGVKLSSLQKLTDIRANKPGMNLIHFVAMQAEKRNPELIKFPSQLGAIENASKTTSEQINNEINTLDGRIRKIKRQIEQPSTDKDIKEQMLEFLHSAEREVAVLKAGMKEVEVMRFKLTDFFCEDPATFRLEECFKIFQTFCDKFKQAVKENESRQQLEEQAILRRKQREEQLARRAKQANQCGTPVSDSENQFLLDPSFDPRASPAFSRRRMGSFNSGGDINRFVRMESNDGISPDITPNGSLRRRRSRVLEEEDDLMEFLRTSSGGHEHNSRERKAYGSLDRSWARRARSGSASRKRSDLLNIDFGTDRERPNSPAPIIHHSNKPAAPPSSAGDTPPSASITQQQMNEDAKPRISREWRQKIETWLQLNENDEKQNEEYKRKRRLVNNSRRSLENDIESERKLDTLPEEKIVPTTPGLGPVLGSDSAATITVAPASNSNKDNKNRANKSNDSGNYKRVYPDWKPSNTLEQTDVVGTIQAIADVYSAHDKQNSSRPNYAFTEVTKNKFDTEPDSGAGTGPDGLDVNNSNYLTSVEELRQYRRQRSVENSDKHSNQQLQSIAEEDRRKSYIKKLGESNKSDRLQVHIRRPVNNDVQSAEAKQPRTPIEVIKSPASSPVDGVVAAVPHMLIKTASNTKVNADSLNSSFRKSSSSNVFKYEDTPNKDDTFASLLNHHQSHNENYSRKEIDADNIETPPVTRRVITSLSATAVTLNGMQKSEEDVAMKNEHTKSHNSLDQDAPGHFDRYSLTRRTRRYKRPTDYSSGNEDLVSSKESTESNNSRQSGKVNEIRSLNGKPEAHGTTSILKNEQSDTPPRRTGVSDKTITKLEKVGRHISSINQEDVREAIRNLKSPTGTPERIWSPPRDIISHQNPPLSTDTNTNGNTKTTAANNATISKTLNHELNDEGFEETQSLVSDTPSHGKESTNSSCNEAIELPRQSRQSIKQKPTAAKPAPSSRVADRLQISKLRTTLPQKQIVHARESSPKRLVAAKQVERSRSLRSQTMQTQGQGQQQVTQTPAHFSAAIHMNNYTNNAIKRANSIRKTIGEVHATQSMSSSPSHGASARKRDVERSSSRNSLRSSRSSINSGVSTNTVRRMPIVVTKTPLQTVSVDSSPSKRPLTTQNAPYSRTSNTPYRTTAGGGVPASRSSSSGSSVGPSVVVVRKIAAGNNRSSLATLGSTSFKENQTQQASSSRTNAARAALLVKATMSHTSNAHSVANQSAAQRSNSRSSANPKAVSGFMRPTASSATKRNK